nr:hypothetical protein [Phytohabitans flavus]
MIAVHSQRAAQLQVADQATIDEGDVVELLETVPEHRLDLRADDLAVAKHGPLELLVGERILPALRYRVLKTPFGHARAERRLALQPVGEPDASLLERLGKLLVELADGAQERIGEYEQGFSDLVGARAAFGQLVDDDHTEPAPRVLQSVVQTDDAGTDNAYVSAHCLRHPLPLLLGVRLAIPWNAGAPRGVIELWVA